VFRVTIWGIVATCQLWWAQVSKPILLSTSGSSQFLYIWKPRNIFCQKKHLNTVAKHYIIFAILFYQIPRIISFRFFSFKFKLLHFNPMMVVLRENLIIFLLRVYSKCIMPVENYNIFLHVATYSVFRQSIRSMFIKCRPNIQVCSLS
jgi:hypothetical protein